MEHIEYTRTVVPSSMRSPYWKYFGFPSDNGNNILTRQKIVCTICNTAIAYNKNTSNLRTHLMSKHVEIFQNIMTSSATLNPKQDSSFHQNLENVATDYGNNISISDTKRQRTETRGDEQLTASMRNENIFFEHILPIPESSVNLEQTIDTTVVSNKIELEIQNTDYITFLPSNHSEMVTESKELFRASNMDNTGNEKEFTYTDADLSEEYEQQLHSIDIMLADLIQTDLLPLYVLEERGFCKYNQQLTGLNLDDNTLRRVNNVIERRFENVNQVVTSHVKRISQSLPYSLSFEIYTDTEGHEILNIYFNYLNDNQMALISILYSSKIVFNQSINISEILVDINLKNCGGVVVTSLDNLSEFVLDFTKFYELPLIECLESMLTRCLQKVFELTEFSSDYEKLLQIVLENKSKLKRPNFRPRCTWSTFKFLECVLQNEELNSLEEMGELRRSFEYIKPLKIVMDVISDETLPLCSLTRPLIKKLFEEHFNSINPECSRIYKIQKILEKELYERIMDVHFLNEVTFFDLRFHRDIALQHSFFNITNFKTEIIKRFEHNLEVTYINQPSNMKIKNNLTDPITNTRKCSSLKSFLKRDIFVAKTDITTNIDLEIDQYRIQPCLDLDQSPVLWWQQQSDTYKQLSKIAKYYLTIPCCCLPRLCRINSKQRFSKLNQRKNLSQLCNTERNLWYLHYNEDVAEFL